jgi:iron complex outermembrane receptor protein
LKDSPDGGSATVRTAGDGEMIGVSLNNGTYWDNRGFINYTVDFLKRM